MRNIDLRSDTVTLPTPQMRQAMYQAEVGDDVYREDPTVRELEELGASLAAKEAGLFVTSGTMGNQVALMAHTEKGTEVICEAEAHLYYYEVGGMAYLSAAQARLVTGVKGILTPEMIKKVIRPRDIHQPQTALICLENTHNRAGGTYYTPSELAGIKDVAASAGIPIHMDGARVFNAAAAQNLSANCLTQYADSVMFCLSKGLCAPVGALLVGSHSFIERCRRYRKMVGGGMRQAGIIAAAGIVALNTMRERLPEDHANARHLGEGLANLGLSIDLSSVVTNIVITDVSASQKNAAQLAAELAELGIKASVFGEYKLRFVTHHGINKEDIDYTINMVAKVLN